jgi:hypothetical protein
MMRDNRGMTILEVAVSGAILAVILLGIANFSAFTAKMNQSNNQSDNFAGIMSTINNIIKTQDCDVMLGGIPAPTASGSTLPFVGFSPIPGVLVLESPSPAPSGFAFGTGTDPTSFQLTFIKNMDSATITSPAATWDLNTYDLRVAMKKVDSSGNAMAGNPIQMKDYLVNLWADHTTGVTILPQGTAPNQYGTCTYKKPVVFSGPAVTPACVTFPGNFSVQWSMPVADTPTLWFSPDWGITNPVTAPPSQGQMTYSPAAPNGNFNDLTVAMTVSDPGGNVSPSSTSSPAVSVYQSPTVTAVFNPISISSPAASLPLTVTTNANIAGGAVSIVSPITVTGLVNGVNSIPVNITVPETYNFTIVATNGCGTTAQAIATVTYSTTCVPSCSTVPAPCPSGTSYGDGCGGSCSCPTGACTGCPANSTYCASAVPPTDSCGNSCGAGTEAAGGGCPAPTAVCAGSPMPNDTCGNLCPGTPVETCASPSPSPSGCGSGPPCAEVLTGGPGPSNYNTCACTVACPLVSQGFITTDPFAPVGTYSYCGGSTLGQGCGCLGGTPPGTQCFGPPCAVGTCLPDPLFPLTYICQ